MGVCVNVCVHFYVVICLFVVFDISNLVRVIVVIRRTQCCAVDDDDDGNIQWFLLH